MVKSLRLLLTWLILVSFCTPAHAIWVWTPESNKWENPKFTVKETPKAQLDFAIKYFERRDFKRATAELNKLIKHYPKAREAAEAHYYLAMIQEKQGKLFEAFKAYQTVIEKYPFSERAGEIVKRQYDIGQQLMEGKGRKSKVVSTVVGGEYDVVEVFRTVIKNAPYGEYAAPAQYKIGLYLLGKEMYLEARDEFEKTMNDYPDSEWAKAARYQSAMADARRSSGVQYDQKVLESAVKEFDEFVKQYPEAELSENAQKEARALREKEAEKKFLVAKFYVKQGKYQAAKLYLTKIVDDYRNTSWASKALTEIREINRRYLHDEK